MKQKNVFNKLPDFFLAQLLSLSFVLALTTSLGFNYPYFSIYIMILAATTAFSIIFNNRLSAAIAGSLAGLVVIASIYVVAFRTGIEKLLNFLDDYFYWLSDFIAYSGTPDPTCQMITVVALCVSISLLTYIFIIKKFIFYIPLIVGSAIFTIQWSFGMTVSILPFYIFLPVILILYFKHIHARKSAAIPNEYLNNGWFTLWVIPVCIIAVLLASALHAGDKPLEWKWLDKKINSVYNYFNNKFDYEVFDYFSVSSSGFGGKDNLLGGRVKLNKTLVLKVETPRNVYLKGIVKDVYTGTRWVTGSSETKSIGNDYTSLYTDTNEMLTGMKLLTTDPSYLDKYFFKDEVNITFQNLKTKSLFIPSKTFSFTPDAKTINGITDANGSFSAHDRLNKGFKYSIELYNPKLGSDEFIEALRKSRASLYDDYLKAILPTYFSSSVVENINNQSIQTDSTTGSEATDADQAVNSAETIIVYGENSKEIHKFRELQESAREIETKYLQLPESLPQRVRDLAVSITGSYDNRYDKVKAIEHYLSSKFPYNLDVRSTPRNRDFVDYFIFDLKKGYCTYYASAMAVLARSAGIPARYVEGYMLPPKPTESGSTTYLISNMQAHAWVEVYFEGYGWLPFEPTSTFRSNFYSDKSIQALVSSSYNSAYDDYMEMVTRYSRYNNLIGEDIIAVTEEQKTNYPVIVAIVVGTIIFIFLLVLTVNLVRSKLRLYRILNLPPKECILKLYDYFVKILSLQGLGLRSGETPFQYSKRIDGFMYFSPIKFKAVTEIFARCRYSLNDANEKEKQLVSDFRSSFMSETKINMGKSKFFLLKCILGKI